MPPTKKKLKKSIPAEPISTKARAMTARVRSTASAPTNAKPAKERSQPASSRRHSTASASANAKLAKMEAQRVPSRTRSTASADAKARFAKNQAQPVPSRTRSAASVDAKARLAKNQAQSSIEDQVEAVLKSLERLAEKRVLADMFDRYNIRPSKAFGVSMSNIQKVAKPLGRNHDLAAALWETGWYEARMLTSFIDDPALVTSAQMDRWAREFDNWGIVDTLCFNLFDRTPHAWRKVTEWTNKESEFVKRAGFALLWSLTVHDKLATDEPFLQGMEFIERAADDERHFVKKAVNMALRAVGKRNPALNAAAVAAARRLAESQSAAARWVGKDALRELTSASVTRRLTSCRPSE